MSETLQNEILAEALKEVPFSGFSTAALQAAAERAGATSADVAVLFPAGAESLVSAFSHWADARMATHLAAAAPTRVRERVAAAVRYRIEAIAAHKEAARRAAAFLALPQHAPLATTLLFKSVDAMWRAAGRFDD